MTVHLIQGTTVTIHATEPDTVPIDALLVRCEEDLAGSGLTLPQLTALWSALSGNTLTRRFRSRGNALHAVWAALCRLGATEEETDPSPVRSKQALLIALLRREGGATPRDSVHECGGNSPIAGGRGMPLPPAITRVKGVVIGSVG